MPRRFKAIQGTSLSRVLMLGFFILVVSLARHSDACTLWAAVGDIVAGNGTLIAKNRDWKPDHVQDLRIVHPAKGYSSITLNAVGGSEPGIKAGINQHGLVIISATAGQFPRAERSHSKQKPGLMRSLLEECATVQDVLRETERFKRPVFYLIADRTTIALLEIDINGRVHIEQRHSGVLTHTNHYRYLDTRTSRPPAPSSTARLDRIDQLVKEQKNKFTLDDFIQFSNDRTAGPDNSIWRSGSSPGKARTLASWIVSLKQHESPLLYLKTADPGQAEKTCVLKVSDALKLAAGSISLDSNLCKGVY